MYKKDKSHIIRRHSGCASYGAEEIMQLIYHQQEYIIKEKSVELPMYEMAGIKSVSRENSLDGR